jgi:hypothetical protein
MRWSVVVQADGDRVLTLEEIVELADAVAASSGIAAGIGTTHYGAQIVVIADSEGEAVRLATAELTAAAARAGLPAWPVRFVDAVSEADEGYADDEGSADDEAIG